LQRFSRLRQQTTLPDRGLSRATPDATRCDNEASGIAGRETLLVMSIGERDAYIRAQYYEAGPFSD
jgi:hypothetical protein